MRKYEIVNALVKKNGYQSYLEVSTPGTGFTFARVDRRNLRVCHRLMYRCPGEFNDGSEVTFRSADDRAENLLPDGAVYDVVFVDAWHTFACAQRDLQLAFSLVSPGGVMVVHDCLPPNRAATIPSTVGNPWCGVGFCAYVEFIWSEPQAACYTVDTDYGCGVVRKLSTRQPANASVAELQEQWHRERRIHGDDMFDFFYPRRKELVNLVTLPEFLEMEGVKPPTLARMLTLARARGRFLRKLQAALRGKNGLSRP